MLRSRSVPALAFSLMLATPAVPAPVRPVVDGWTFVTNTKSTERGVPETQMQAQVTETKVRVDWQKAAPGMSKDSYMILDAETGVLTMVSPKEKEATILPIGGMASMMGAMGMGGVMKVEISDLAVSVDEGGAGEEILGYPTRKFTMTQAYTMRMQVGPIKRTNKIDNTTELWVANVPPPHARAFEAFAKNFAQNFANAGFGGEGLKALTDEIAAKMPRGLTLRSVSTNKDDKGKVTGTTTTEVREFKQAPIDPKVFEIPADYKVNDMTAAMKKG